jgi:hypothetical protein
VVAKATLLVSTAAVIPFVVPLRVVVEVPAVPPMAIVVVEPDAPFVPMETALVRPVAVTPVAKSMTCAPVPEPREMLLMTPVIGPAKVVVPWSVVVDVPAVEPMVMLFVLPARALVPMPMVRVWPVAIAPVPKL